MRDKRKNSRGRSNVLKLGGSSVLQHLMPRSTLVSKSTVSPGASARGGFGMGIPAGGGGGTAAALAGSPVGGPIGPSMPGVAPPPPFIDLPPGLPGPSFPPRPAPLTPAQSTPQAGLFPHSAPPLAVDQLRPLRGQYPTRPFF